MAPTTPISRFARCATGRDVLGDTGIPVSALTGQLVARVVQAEGVAGGSEELARQIPVVRVELGLGETQAAAEQRHHVRLGRLEALPPVARPLVGDLVQLAHGALEGQGDGRVIWRKERSGRHVTLLLTLGCQQVAMTKIL